MGRPTSLTSVLVVATLVATGCASTNQRGQGGTINDLLTIDSIPSEGPSGAPGGAPVASGEASPTTNGTAAGEPGVTPGADGSSEPDASNSPGSGQASAGPGQTPPGVSPAGSPSSSPKRSDDKLVMGPGVTKDTITIGFQAGETGAAFAAVGAGLQPAYEGDMARALVDWLNATGGIRGREVVGVYHETETTQGSWASQAQATCGAFTEDATTFAVISSAVGGDDSLAACLHEKQTPLFELNTWIWDQPYFDEFPNLYRPGHFRAEDGYAAYLRGLAADGFFDGATVGLLRFDAPVFARMMDKVVNPVLKDLGVTYTEAVISSPGGLSDFGSAGAQMGNAVLRFRAAGVDHVIMIENAGIMPFFFLKEAESQGFRPTYGFSTIDIPQTQASQGSPNQLRNAVAIGWAPPIDVNRDDNPNQNANFQLCEKILTDGGVTNMAGFYAQSRCDAVFVLREALERATELTAKGLREAMAGLGSKHQSPFTREAFYGPGKRWAARSVQTAHYVDDCECFRYVGSARRVL